MNKKCNLFLLTIISCLFSFSIISVNAKFLDYFKEINYINDFAEENIEDYDLYHLLSYDESKTFFKWLDDNYKLKIEKDKDNEFIKNNLSKFVLLAMQKGIVKNYYAEYTVL